MLGTGGYAVVRACVHKASGARYAAKMMTVSDCPASGGRDIDREARCFLAVLQCMARPAFGGSAEKTLSASMPALSYQPRCLLHHCFVSAMSLHQDVLEDTSLHAQLRFALWRCARLHTCMYTLVPLPAHAISACRRC